MTGIPLTDAAATRVEARPGLPLGRPLGVPVYLAPSWIVVGVLITSSLASFFSNGLTPSLPHYAAAAGAAVLFAASVLAHELGHAAVSLNLGIPIRRITLHLFGGVAEMEREPSTAAGEYLVLSRLLKQNVDPAAWNLLRAENAACVNLR